MRAKFRATIESVQDDLVSFHSLKKFRQAMAHCARRDGGAKRTTRVTPADLMRKDNRKRS